MFGTLYLLDSIQAAVCVATVIVIGLIIVGVRHGTLEGVVDELHFIVKVSCYDDANLIERSWARVICACTQEFTVRAMEFDDSAKCERLAVEAFEQHQQKEGIRAK